MDNIIVSNTEELRNVFHTKKENLNITLKTGKYSIDKTLKLNNLNNVHFIGEPGVILIGGRKIHNFMSYGRDNIFVCDLDMDIPVFKMRGYGFQAPENALMFFRDGKPLIMSRYPKENFIKIEKIISDGKDGSPSVFEYEDPYFDTFAEEKNLLLFGYFCWDWADATVKAYIDKNKKQIVIDPPYHYKNEYFLSFTEIPMYYAENILSELSENNEYYLDSEKKKLYVRGNEPVEITSLSGNMIEMNKCHNVTFENIVFDMGQSSAIVGENTENIEIKNCQIKRFASEGIKLEGNNIKITDNDIHTFGRGAVEVRGGNFKTLSSGNISVFNNRIHNVGNIDKTYVPCVLVKGVGVHIAHNEMWDATSSAIRLEGNDCLIEYNYIHNTVSESDDQGAIDMYYNLSYRGNIFRYNFFEDNGNSKELKIGNSGIRFDDIISGQHVYGNIFLNTTKGGFGAVQINSGRDNIIENNIIINSENAFSGGFNHINPAWAENLNDPEVFYTDLYLKKYPEMKKCYDEKGEVKKDGCNIYRNNVLINCSNIVSQQHYSDIEKENYPNMHSREIILTENDIDENFQVKADNFPQIPYNEIGNE